MSSAFARPRRLVAALALLSMSALLGACALGDDDAALPPFTDPATQNYATSTGVVITGMTRVNAQVYTQDVVVGTGRTILVGDSIAVYYAGKLTSGFQFDARARPSTPFSTVLDNSRLITGWVIGLAGAKVGGTRRLVIGPQAAYQFDSRRDGLGNVIIPPNSVLVFDVEVVDAASRP